MNIAVEISPLTSINPNTLNLNLNTELATIVSINSICRLCATNSDRFINFYGPEGISNDLPNKINSYLPIKVQVTDELPQQCCLNCASTLLAWHELVLVSVETDRRLRTYQLVNEKTIFNIQFEGAASAEDVLGPQEHQQEQHHVEGLEPSSVIGVPITAADCLNDFCQTQTTPANNTTNSIICHDSVENFATNNAALSVVNQEQIELKVEEKLCDVSNSNSRPVSHAKRRRKDKLEPRCSSPELNPAVLDTFLFANIEKHLIGDGTDDLTKQSTVNADEFKIHIKDSGGMLKLEDDLHCQSNNDMLLGDSLVRYLSSNEYPRFYEKTKLLKKIGPLKTARANTDIIIISFVNPIDISCSIPNGVQLNIVQPQHPITQADDNPHHHHHHHQNNKFLHCLNDSNPDGNDIVLARTENGGGSLDTTILENNDAGCYLKLEENCDNDDGENNNGNDDYNDDYNDGDDDDEEDDDVEDELAFACYHCTAIFIPRDGVFEHMKREHPDLPAVDPVPQAFACVHCAAIFLLREDVYEHMRKDHGEMPVLDPVPHSISPGRRGRRRRNNKGDHKKKKKRQNVKLDQKAANEAKVVVDGKIYYNCKECGKSLHSPYTYSWHTRIHTGERPYVCDLCGKQFRVSQGLVRHLRETHEGIKKFACDLCGRMFATRRNVDEHRRIHTNERPYVCDLCGKSFKQKASLFVHKRSHKNYFPFVCVYCNRGFRTKPPLMVHVTKHTGEKPYKCDTCGRAFRIKYELKRHKLIHSEAKPFACSYCGLCFRQKRYLRNHFKSSHNRTGDEQTPA